MRAWPRVSTSSTLSALPQRPRCADAPMGFARRAWPTRQHPADQPVVAPMKRALCALLGTLALACSAQPKLNEQALADVGTINVPAGLKAEAYAGYDSERMNRQSFQFTSTRFWTWPGGPTRYRQWLVVSVMAADAGDAEYATRPRGMNLLYEQVSKGPTRPLGPGLLTLTEGLYHVDGVDEPAVEYLYVDKARRLQIAWHALRKVIDVASATTALSHMARSFRLQRDPVAVFAEARAEPVRQAQARARNRALVQDLFKREGLPAVVPCRPVLHKGVYVEWMDDPESRFQLLVPLGRVRAAAKGSVVDRPRPLSAATGIGWREISDGEWVFSNQDRGYLPMKGLTALLAERQRDPGFVYFYVVATVRVEEEQGDQRLTSLDWFFERLPELQRRWRQGLLVGPGQPEAD